jgi:hypothetical protein
MLTRSHTRKRFTVELSCCDPVVPVQLTHSNYKFRAQIVYDALERQLHAEGNQTEWTLTLYKHPLIGGAQPTPLFAPASDTGNTCCYYVQYATSQEVHSTSYSQHLA